MSKSKLLQRINKKLQQPIRITEYIEIPGIQVDFTMAVSPREFDELKKVYGVKYKYNPII